MRKEMDVMINEDNSELVGRNDGSGPMMAISGIGEVIGSEDPGERCDNQTLDPLPKQPQANISIDESTNDDVGATF